jgi:hypothetical protein
MQQLIFLTLIALAMYGTVLGVFYILFGHKAKDRAIGVAALVASGVFLYWNTPETKEFVHGVGDFVGMYAPKVADYAIDLAKQGWHFITT